MLIDDLLGTELPDDEPARPTDEILTIVRNRVHRRARRRRVVAVACVIAALVPLVAVVRHTRRADQTSVDTASLDPSEMRTDRWIVDGATPRSIREGPLPFGETLEIYGVPSAGGIGLDRWVALSVSNSFRDRRVQVPFSTAHTDSSTLDGDHELGVITEREQTQVAFTDRNRRIVVLSGLGVPADELIVLARSLARDDATPYTIEGADLVRSLERLVLLGPGIEPPLQTNVDYGAERLTTVALPRGGELFYAVWPHLPDFGRVETIGDVVGWRMRVEGQSWTTYREGAVISMAGSAETIARLRHPTRAEWDELRRNHSADDAPTAPTANSYFLGWDNFALTDPCDLLATARASVPGDQTWRSALERFAQRIERADLVGRSRELAGRADAAARGELDTLFQSRPCR